MLVLIGAALLVVPAMAKADPYPPTNCSSTSGAGLGVGDGGSSCTVAPTATQRTSVPAVEPSHETESNGTASTGFQTLTATGIAVALLAGGLAFVLVGRRRRHG